MRLGMIWAEATNGAIGLGGEMPWHLPEDLAHFKRVTLGSPVIMGRRTWESLPPRLRPLTGRENFVVTRDTNYRAPGASVRSSLEDTLLSVAETAPEIAWIMGGGELYRVAMALADELSVTRIDLDVPEADTFAPEIGADWQLVDGGEPLVSRTGLKFRFERWARH